MKITNAVLLFTLLPLIANAGDPLPYQVCPKLTDDAGKILSSIETLRASLKKGPECQSIADKMSVVGKIVQNPNWKEVKDILSKKSNAVMDTEKMAGVTQLVEEAAYAISDSVAQLSAHSDCTDGTGYKNVLGSISSITQEVTGVVGALSGPYGAAISTGGKILAKVIEGISKLIQALRRYNFDNVTERELFANQFCSFAEIQRDLYDNINLPNRLVELNALRSSYQEKVTMIKNNCKECAGYAAAWEAKEKADKIEPLIRKTTNLQDTTELKEKISRCSQIQEQAHVAESDVNRYLDVFVNYQNPAASAGDLGYIEQIKAVQLKLKSYPTLSECLNLPISQRSELSHDFNLFIRDEVLSFTPNLLGTQMGRFFYLGNYIYAETLGTYIGTSLERLKWIKGQYEEVRRKLKDANYDYSRIELREAQKRIKKSVMDDIFPRYLKYLVKKNLKTVKEADAQADEHTAYEKDPSTKWDDRFVPSVGNSAESKKEAAFERTRAIIRYCDYTNYLQASNLQIQEICANADEQLKAAYISYFGIGKEELATLFTHDHNHVMGSRVSEYQQIVATWNLQGDARWRHKLPEEQ